MNRSLAISQALLFVGLCACTTGLTAAGRKVEVATAATDKCEDLGRIYGSGSSGGYTSPEAKKRSAANELRNRAGEIGGNLVVIDEPDPAKPKAPQTAQAYRCGDEVAAPSEPATAAAPATVAPGVATAGGVEGAAAPAVESAAPAPGAPAPVVAPPEERLKKLQALLQQGLITQEEHDAQRADIIQSL